ncbi:MAG: hypothetical protein QXT44_00635 [Candidatus Bathyarchaeia archaeon]
MDKRGQFSLIAALLVAVVLIATVIVTYSTIRSLPMEEQPQVLSAIDETNLALKQILGFTVGYYGSILQVTGDREYAYKAAYKYLMSGFEYIARMHPERAVSFNLKNMNLQTYWFASQSYSKGCITVQYDLSGLGIYGINYTVSCKLNVNILGTDGGKAYIRVTADENNEPILNLGRSSFKFYLYRCSNSTWAMVTPSTEPTVFSDGRYAVDIPPGVDEHSYVVQVEDSRGIVVVASSFSCYTLTLTWNSTFYSSIGAITRMVNETLINRESFELGWPSGWAATGNWARERDQAYDGSWSADFDGPNRGSGSASGNLTTPELNCYGVNMIYVDFWYRDEGCDAGDFLLQYYNGSAWITIADLGASSTENQWLNYKQTITDSQYFKPNFRIRWYAHLERDEHAYVDYVTVVATKTIIISAEDFSPITVEVLQNGTIRWLGEHLQLITQAKPIPPIPVKAIRVNQTINGVDQEVPFQVEDWASDYRVPLGLTNNASIFSSRNMLVFLVNPKVSKVTIWWNGSDAAKQTPYAYTNRYFKDNPPTFSNGILTLRFGSSGFHVDATVGSITSTADLMRINDEEDTTNPEWGWTLYNGVVRDIVQGEPEWGTTYGFGGADRNGTCYNIYAHVVITLPANATYYTYQLRLIFLNSTDQPRTITQIRLIRITASGTFSALTENGTLPTGYPRVSGSGFFYNFSASCWQHRWAQLESSLKGFGIMFTDEANKMLYSFDNETLRGALKVINSTTERTIELLPVSHERPPVINHVHPLDICWYGAVVTFDRTLPIYTTLNGVPKGLWVLVEYPPVVSVTPGG